MIQITPIEFPILGIATQLRVVVQSFDTLERTCSLIYTFFTEDNRLITEGTYALTEEEFKEWASDNDYLNHLIADKLKIQII